MKTDLLLPEEDPPGAAMWGQADRFSLTDFKETLKALDVSSEIRWLSELLLMCLECRAFISAGSREGFEINTKNPSLLIKCYLEGLSHRLGKIPGNSHVHSTVESPAETNTCRSLKASDGDSLKGEDSFFVDNEFSDPNPDSTMRTEQRTCRTPEVYINRPDVQKREGNRAEDEKVTSNQSWFEERIMGKIDEVEGIIRRMSLTSLDGIEEKEESSKEDRFLTDRGDREEQLRCRPEVSDPSLEDNMESHACQQRLVEELRVLCEAVSRSLHQALRLEGARADVVAFVEEEQSCCDQDQSVKKTLPSHPPPVTTCNSSQLPIDASSSRSADEETALDSFAFLQNVATITPVKPNNLGGGGHTEQEISEDHLFPKVNSVIFQEISDYQKEVNRCRCETQDDGDDMLSSGRMFWFFWTS